MVADAVVSAASGLGMGLGMGAGYGILSGLLKQSSRWISWQLIPVEMKRDLIAHAMQNLLSAEKDSVSGMSTAGAVDTMLGFINKTIDFSVWVGEGMASQMFLQMIQQSMAYAIHASHAGSVGTVGNVYAGGMYLSGSEASSIGENIDLLDRASRGFLSAEVGQNIPTLAYNIIRGSNRRIDSVYRSLMRNIDGLLDEWNDLTLSYYRQYHSMCRTRLGNALTMKEKVVTRAYGLLEQVANEHLARISEQLDTIEGAKAWFDAGLMENNDLKLISTQVDLEREASESNYNEYKDEIFSAISSGITEWDEKITQALNDLKDTELQYAVLIQNVYSSLFADVFDFVTALATMADRAIVDVCAYRNIKPAIEAKVTEEIGVLEMSPETEVYGLTYKKWVSIPPITRTYHYQRPRGLKWTACVEEDKGVAVIEKATVLPRRHFEGIEDPIVVHHTQPTPLTPWVDA